VVATTTETSEVYALRYANATSTKARHFCNFQIYGEPDGDHDLDFYFWLIKSPGRIVLVDCGFDPQRALRKGRKQNVDPLTLLSRVGVRAVDVDHVIISHMHYDHVGNLGLFPNAGFSIARSEYDYWTGPMAGRNINSWIVDEADISMVRSLRKQERLQLLDGEQEVFPGLVTSVVGGHTPGQTIVKVEAGAATVILASDAAHFYDELRLDRPFNVYHDFDGLYRGYDRLRALEQRPGAVVVAGHDPEVRDLFEETAPDCFDLLRPVQLRASDRRSRSHGEVSQAP
jgi:glyoxylase-like metal-dependent hydrolase (beta-lactamase superfamily II)